MWASTYELGCVLFNNSKLARAFVSRLESLSENGVAIDTNMVKDYLEDKDERKIIRTWESRHYKNEECSICIPEQHAAHILYKGNRRISRDGKNLRFTTLRWINPMETRIFPMESGHFEARFVYLDGLLQELVGQKAKIHRVAGKIEDWYGINVREEYEELLGKDSSKPNPPKTWYKDNGRTKKGRKSGSKQKNWSKDQTIQTPDSTDRMDDTLEIWLNMWSSRPLTEAEMRHTIKGRSI